MIMIRPLLFLIPQIFFSHFNLLLPKVKFLPFSKILKIYFFFKTKDLMQNFDALVCFIPHKTLAFLNLNDSLYSKVTSINEYFSSKIFFLSRIIPLSPKHVKTLTSFLFKFLWNFSVLKQLSTLPYTTRMLLEE